MNYIISIFSSILFRLGGWGDSDFAFGIKSILGLTKGNKNWRWFGIGSFIGVLYFINGMIRNCFAINSLEPFRILGFYKSLLCIPSYFIATSVFSYGENHWLRKLVGRNSCWVIYGLFFGLASFPVLGKLCMLQGIIGGVIFYILMKLSNDGIFRLTYGKEDRPYVIWYLDHKYVEILFGFFGTIMFWFH